MPPRRNPTKRGNYYASEFFQNARRNSLARRRIEFGEVQETVSDSIANAISEAAATVGNTAGASAGSMVETAINTVTAIATGGNPIAATIASPIASSIGNVVQGAVSSFVSQNIEEYALNGSAESIASDRPLGWWEQGTPEEILIESHSPLRGPSIASDNIEPLEDQSPVIRSGSFVDPNAPTRPTPDDGGGGGGENGNSLLKIIVKKTPEVNPTGLHCILYGFEAP